MFLFDRLYSQEKASPSLFALPTHDAFNPALRAERNKKLLHIFVSVRLQMHATKSLCQLFFQQPGFQDPLGLTLPDRALSGQNLDHCTPSHTVKNLFVKLRKIFYNKVKSLFTKKNEKDTEINLVRTFRVHIRVPRFFLISWTLLLPG